MERQPGSPRYFTLDEASRVLPRVRDVLLRLRAAGTEVAACQEAIQRSGHAPVRRRDVAPARNGAGHTNGSGTGLYTVLSRLNGLLQEMRTLAEELEGIGCEVKDVQSGLVDFRSMRDGRAVFLCWRLGEDGIHFWHELDTGFAGRQPI